MPPPLPPLNSRRAAVTAAVSPADAAAAWGAAAAEAAAAEAEAEAAEAEAVEAEAEAVAGEGLTGGGAEGAEETEVMEGLEDDIENEADVSALDLGVSRQGRQPVGSAGLAMSVR